MQGYLIGALVWLLLIAGIAFSSDLADSLITAAVFVAILVMSAAKMIEMYRHRHDPDKRAAIASSGQTYGMPKWFRDFVLDEKSDTGKPKGQKS